MIVAVDFDADQRRAALRDFMEREKLRPSSWETAADLGEGTLRKFLKSTQAGGTLTDRTYTLLASAASKLLDRNVSVVELQHITKPNNNGGLAPAVDAMLEDRQTIVPAPSLPKNEPGQFILVMGTSLAGGEGDFQMNTGEPIDKVPLPAHLRYRKGLLAVIVEGTSMLPWKKPRQTVVFDTLVRPSNGDHVIVQLRPIPPYEDRPAYLKLLVRRTPTKLVLAQYRPAREIEIDLKRVHSIYRVLESDELLGWHSSR